VSFCTGSSSDLSDQTEVRSTASLAGRRIYAAKRIFGLSSVGALRRSWFGDETTSAQRYPGAPNVSSNIGTVDLNKVSRLTVPFHFSGYWPPRRVNNLPHL
jgi:hypothetical protein